MSVHDQNQGAPILPGSPLARALDDFAVPGLSAGFAERVMAGAEARAAPLPDLRRPARIGPRGWRMGRRIAIGIASFGALATAAAATGLLGQLAIPVPSAQTVWASITGTAAAAPAPHQDKAPALAAAEPTPLSTVAIEGPIDTPEELGEAFRRVDQVRTGRREERRAMIDQRIRSEIERRRAAGLPVPTPEEEAKLRARIDAELARRQQRADAAIAARREAMERKVANGEALTREDIAGRPPLDPKLRETVRTLRALSPKERREAWRRLPPEDRRALTEQWRARRGAAAVQPAAPASEPSPAEAPTER